MQTVDFNPLVSVIIPVYNGSNYLAEAIDSALAQTYKNIEVIVVNDGSADEGKTEEIAYSYGDRIKYFTKENGGVSSALNVGIKNMSGEYFSWLSHDDKYVPQKIEKQVKALSGLENKETVVLCSSSAIDKNSNPISGRKGKNKFENGEVVPWQKAFKELFDCGVFNGCALLIHKNIFKAVGGFEESFRYIQDLYMWANIFLNKFSLVYISDKLVFSRVHGAQLTQTGRKLFYEESVVMCEKLLPELATVENEYSESMIYSYASYNARYNNKNVVARTFDFCRHNRKLSLVNGIRLMFMSFYGSLRPLIRKVYFKLILKVPTE